MFRAGRHTANLDSVLEILACLEASRTDPFQKLMPVLAEELNGISTVIAILLDWDTPEENLVRTVVESGCSAKIVIVRDGETTRPCTQLPGVHAIACYTPAEVTRGDIERL